MGGYGSQKVFVTVNELETLWTPFVFNVSSTNDEGQKKAVVRMFTKMMEELHQYGILEDYRDEMYSIAREGDAVNLALFGDAKTTGELEQQIRSNLRNNVPEDYADELNHSDGDQFFYLLHHLKDPINEMVNTLTK